MVSADIAEPQLGNGIFAEGDNPFDQAAAVTFKNDNISAAEILEHVQSQNDAPSVQRHKALLLNLVRRAERDYTEKHKIKQEGASERSEE
jgi:hypothetical protein